MKFTENRDYVGVRENPTDVLSEASVFVYDMTTGAKRELPPRNDLVNHSPDGFEWGYAGSGPAQLAFAILLDAFDEKTARTWYQEFKDRKIATLRRDRGFVMPVKEVWEWMDLMLVRLGEQEVVDV